MVERAKFLSADEYEDVTQVMETLVPEEVPRWLDLGIRVLWATGCRPSEVFGCQEYEAPRAKAGRNSPHTVKAHHGIRGRDLLSDRRIHVEGKRSNPHQKTTELKGRVVLCTEEEAWERLQTRAEAASDTSENLLCAEYDDPQSASYYYLQKLKEHLPPASEELTFRWLRHSHAIHALREGVDLRSVQQQLGHEDLTTTATYLRHAGLDDDAYLAAFGGREPEAADLRTSCPSCGFDFTIDRETGEPTWEARMGRAMERERP